MLKETAEAGFYHPPGLADKFPRPQILSIAEMLAGKQVEYPRLLDVHAQEGSQSEEGGRGTNPAGRGGSGR